MWWIECNNSVKQSFPNQGNRIAPTLIHYFLRVVRKHFDRVFSLTLFTLLIFPYVDSTRSTLNWLCHEVLDISNGNLAHVRCLLKKLIYRNRQTFWRLFILNIVDSSIPVKSIYEASSEVRFFLVLYQYECYKTYQETLQI